MLSEINIEQVFSFHLPIIDVRSPGEFAKGHIPNAINIPLFTDDERAHVGTVYVQQSQEVAIKLGYEYVTPKLQNFINDAFKVAPNGEVIVHCWRGGMRSHAFAQHLVDNGFSEVKLIIGGYKAYRNYVLHNLASPAHIKVLGGYTGSGKTYILEELNKLGNQVIDLEGLANHKGSAFGGIGQPEQPTVEQFENNLHAEFMQLDLSKPIWVEDESYDIGRVKIPKPFFEQMQASQLYFIEIPQYERAKHLVIEYGICDKQKLADSILRISQRLGGLSVKNSIAALEQDDFYEVAMITLHYYDKLYAKGMNNPKWKNVITIPLPSINHLENALKIEKLK
ncbi:MAG: tRNA 2-selenouridine(34) synthase MnmH [Paludibacter sp.]